MLAILSSAIFSVGYSREFRTQQLESTGFSVTISVGEDETTVDVVGPDDRWLGVGFGGLTMSAGTSASIYTGSETLEARIITSESSLTSFDSPWTVSNYVQANGQVSYTITRDNDVSATCADCFAFDPSADTLDIIMARGTSTTFQQHGFSFDGNAAGYTVDAQSTTSTTDHGQNQSKMDDLCRLMRWTDELEALLEANTERFFVLADQVENEKALMRSFEELSRLTGTVLTAQMKIIGSLREELEVAAKNYEAAANAQGTEELTIKALCKQFKAITTEQDRVRRRMSREIDEFDKINSKLLQKYERALAAL